MGLLVWSEAAQRTMQRGRLDGLQRRRHPARASSRQQTGCLLLGGWSCCSSTIPPSP